jgi:hypothetical protein
MKQVTEPAAAASATHFANDSHRQALATFKMRLEGVVVTPWSPEVLTAGACQIGRSQSHDRISKAKEPRVATPHPKAKPQRGVEPAFIGFEFVRPISPLPEQERGARESPTTNLMELNLSPPLAFWVHDAPLPFLSFTSPISVSWTRSAAPLIKPGGSIGAVNRAEGCWTPPYQRLLSRLLLVVCLDACAWC